MRLILRSIGLLLLLAVAAVGLFLGEAHWEMRQINPPLPGFAEIEDALAEANGPVQISYINTATQKGGGIETIHPSYVIEWDDGRYFLIDLGMDHDSAIDFGENVQSVLDADPIEPHGSVAELLWAQVPRVQAVAFTHLHVDHTNGLSALCEAVDHKVTIFQTALQAEKGNHTTSPGQEIVDEAPCAKAVKLSAKPIHTFADYPGLAAVAAGGHTPGSTVYFAKIENDIWVLSGDVAWTLDDIRTNSPKPAIYSALIVPESPDRMNELRLWLKSFDEKDDYRVFVSHDRQSLEENAMPKY